jgi:ABC-type antimicrobial peptide transport system permease subunit
MPPTEQTRTEAGGTYWTPPSTLISVRNWVGSSSTSIYPGLGRLLTLAIDRRDLPLLQAITLVAVLTFALSNLLADVLYAILNPRIRLE